MHLKKPDATAPTLPEIQVNSSLESPTRGVSMDASALAAREEYHRHKRNESGLSHHSGRSGSAMSGSRPDMTFFLPDDVSDESKEGSVSYGESDENVSYGVAKPAPISKFQPTWDSYLASPILEGEEESPVSKQATNIVILPTNNTASPLLTPEALKPALETAPIVSSSETPNESPIIGTAEIDTEPEDWVMVNDSRPEDAILNSPKLSPNNVPPPVPPPASEIPPPPVSHNTTQPRADDSTPISSAEPNADQANESGMSSTIRELSTSEILPPSSVKHVDESEESPIIPMPMQRFVSTEMITQDEVESPIIPDIFRTIKGDPPTHYSRKKASAQDGPNFSLPPITRGTSFGSLINGWSGLSRSGSKSSKASRRYQIDADSDAEPEEIPPMPPTPSFARPGTSESTKRAKEKMKAVSVAESDEISQNEENATIGALVAAGLVAAAFDNDKPSPITQRDWTPGTSRVAINRLSTVNSEHLSPELRSERPLSSPGLPSPITQGSMTPKQMFEPIENSSMDPVVFDKQVAAVAERPFTPNQDSVDPAALLTTPRSTSQYSPEQSTPGTLVSESRAPDRLSKSSEQWVENAPMTDTYEPPSHHSPGQLSPSLPDPNAQQTPVTYEETIAARELRRSQRPDVRIDTTPNSSPGLSTRANFNSSPHAHRSLPPYESPKLFVAPPVARQTYIGFGPVQTQSPESAPINQDLDLPEHLYQAPITKDESFLPRQQTSEYQIAGLGPPPNEVPPSATSSSRRSSFFKEIGGRISRTKSLTLDELVEPASPGGSQNNKAVAPSISSVTSEDIKEKMRNPSRRSSLFGLGPGSLSRSSTNNTKGNDPATTKVGGEAGELFAIKPSRRESMITHRPGSRRDTLDSVSQKSEGVRSPISPLLVSPLVPVMEGDGKEKRSAKGFFGNISGRPVPKPPVPMLTVPAVPVVKEKSVKKPRFSRLRLGELLGRGGKTVSAFFSSGSFVKSFILNKTLPIF